MKKTLITLLALGGIACGAEIITNASNTDFDTWFKTAVAGYTTGDDYELSITLNEFIPTEGDYGAINYHSFIILTLDEGSTDGSSWGVFTQGGKYLAFDDSGTDNRSGLTTSTGSSYTSSNKDKATGSLAAPTEGWFYDLGGNGWTEEEIEGLTITLAREDGKQTLSILDVDGITEIANFTITSEIDLADITVSERFTHTASFTTESAAVPEPTTATLSLLALAGLAARRRRR